METILWKKNILFLYCASIWGIIAFFHILVSHDGSTSSHWGTKNKESLKEFIYGSHHLLRPHSTMQWESAESSGTIL